MVLQFPINNLKLKQQPLQQAEENEATELGDTSNTTTPYEAAQARINEKIIELFYLTVQSIFNGGDDEVDEPEPPPRPKTKAWPFDYRPAWPKWRKGDE